MDESAAVYKNPLFLLVSAVLILIAFAPLILYYAVYGFRVDVLNIFFWIFYVVTMALIGFTLFKMWQKGQPARAHMYFLVIFIVVLSISTTIYMLEVLHEFGAFSPPPPLPHCSPIMHISAEVPAYSCSNLTLSTDGTISLKLSQNYHVDLYNFRIACTNSTENVPTGSEVTPLAYPKWMYLTSTGSLSGTYDPSNSYTLLPNKEIQIKSLKCYKTADEPLGDISEGTLFNGSIWISYTPSPGPENSSNLWDNDIFAAISVKATKQS